MNRLKELRKQNNMTLLEVANLLGVTESTVQRYESGVIENLKYDTIVKLSNLYCTTPAYLMGWAQEYPAWKRQQAGYSYASQGEDTLKPLIDAWLNLSDEGQQQLIQYAKFLESQEEK